MLTNKNLSFFLRTLEANYFERNGMFPNQILYHAKEDNNILESFLAHKNNNSLGIILDAKISDMAYSMMKWAHYNRDNIKIYPKYPENIDYFITNIIYTGIQPTLFASNMPLKALNALGVPNFLCDYIDISLAIAGKEISLTIPKVVGLKLNNILSSECNIYDLTLYLYLHIKDLSTYTCFELFGIGALDLDIRDRVAIANLEFEHNSFIFCPFDCVTLAHLKQLNELHYEKIIASYDLFNLFRTNTLDGSIYNEIVEIDLSLIKPIAIESINNNKAIISWFNSDKHIEHVQIEDNKNIICVMNITTCDSQLISFCQLVKQLTANGINVIHSNIKAYVNTDNIWLMEYFRQIKIETILLQLGFEFENSKYIKQVFNSSTCVCITSDLALFSYVGEKIQKAYITSSIHVLLSAIQGSIFINNTLIANQLYATDLLKFRYFNAIWTDLLEHNPIHSLNYSIYKGNKHWHSIPIKIDANPPFEITNYKIVNSGYANIYKPIAYKSVYIPANKKMCFKKANKHMTIVIGVDLLINAITSFENIVLYLSNIFCESTYNTIILNGGLPLQYNLKYLRLDSSDIAEVNVCASKINPCSKVRLSFLLKDNSRIHINTICAIKNDRDFNIYKKGGLCHLN